jgi:uncharacterized membrane protein YeiB
MNVLDEIYFHLLGLVQRYGWTLVFLLVLYYFIQPYLAQLWQKIKENDPRELQRKKILDEQRKRARREQQAKLFAEKDS